MKIQTVIIGEYQISPAVSFCLYQFSSPIITPPRSLNQDQRQENFINYFCLEDLFAIFDLHACKQNLIRCYQQNLNFFCKDEAGRSYIQTHVMAEIALLNNICALADLCRLEDEELLAGGAIPLLKMTTCLRLLSEPKVVIIESFEPRRLDGTEWLFQSSRVKLEPFSPTLPAFISPPPTRFHRLSSNTLTNPSSSSSSSTKYTIMSRLSPPQETDENATIKLPKPSSLLLKRLAPRHGHKKNLTILTPSYSEDSIAHAIQSAPLKRTIASSSVQHRSKANKIVKKSPPTASSVKSNIRRLVLPATASAVTAPWPQTSAQSRFPSPPIVPSQQPAWGQHHPQKQLRPAIKTAILACFPRTPTTVTNNAATTPITATFNHQPMQQHMTQKQKFLQPFEYLYDHIEQTRTLKTTLDDQIRRSSTLMQTLQSSGTMIESLVRRQVRDMVDQKFEDRLRECTERISRLEYRVPTKDIPISPAVSPSPTTTNNSKISSKEPVQDLLTQLMSRIDQLESKLAEKAA